MCDYLALGTTASFKMRSDVPGSVFFVRESVHARACVRTRMLFENCVTLRSRVASLAASPGAGRGQSGDVHPRLTAIPPQTCWKPPAAGVEARSAAVPESSACRLAPTRPGLVAGPRREQDAAFGGHATPPLRAGSATRRPCGDQLR